MINLGILSGKEVVLLCKYTYNIWKQVHPEQGRIDGYNYTDAYLAIILNTHQTQLSLSSINWVDRMYFLL